MSVDRRKFFAIAAGTAAAGTTGIASAQTGQIKSDSELAKSISGGFTSNYVVANGIRQHYVAGGRGEPLILLHGWPQTWWEFRKVMPALAARYRVIAVDLRGAGGTEKPATGYDKKTMAKDIHELVRELGYTKVSIAGHDIGAMVAFSYAINHPQAIDKVAMLDVTHPHEGYYEFRLLPRIGQPFYPWWFAFNQISTLPEQLVAGRSRYLTDWMFNRLLLDPNAISDADRAIFAAHYSYPDAIRGGNSWYQTFPHDIEDMKTYGKVTAPVLGLVCNLFHDSMAAVLPSQGTNVQINTIADASHFFVDEQPNAVIDQLTRFIG